MSGGSRSRWHRDLAICLALLVAAVGFVAMWSSWPPDIVAFDIYEYYLPNVLYALERLHAGGSGLLWNPFQSAGQPFLGISSTGVLYPSNLLYLWLDADRALRALTAGNFAVAGIGAYWLLRELGTGRAAALCGALAFELGIGSVDLNTWGPQMGGSYVWLALAMLCCERLLRTPTVGTTIGLGVALTLALLPGFPQVVVFTYQLIALRVLFELTTGRRPHWRRSLAAVGAGLLLAPFLDAVQLLPGIEMVSRSVRSGNLTLDEIRSGGSATWMAFRNNLAWRQDLFSPVVVVPCMIAGASWLRPATRRVAVFYTLAGLLYFALAFGAATPLFTLYLKLPLGRVFRGPARFSWMTSFCLAVLTGLGADAIVRGASEAASWRRWRPVLFVVATLAGLWVLVPNGLFPTEWVLAAGVIAGAIAAASCGHRIAAFLVVTSAAGGLLAYPSPILPRALNQLAIRQAPMRRLLPVAGILFSRAEVFDWLDQRMTAQDRIYMVHRHPSFALMPKTASLFAVPSIQDYEPQPTYRSAAYLVMLRTGADLVTLLQHYYPGGWVQFTPQFRKRLLDLAAVRYVVVDAPALESVAVVSPPLQRIAAWDDHQLTVYENREALPRAFWVPRLEVVLDPPALLRRLADGTDDLRQVSLVDELPPSGFLGAAGDPSTAQTEFVRDDPEQVVVRVRAPARGFLQLADQNFPGWHATVNGAPAPILRANYLFRAVEVPAGESTVEFRYVPLSLQIGAAITIITLLAIALVGALHRRLSGAGAAPRRA